ncbi:MAG: hypothetical protein PHC29_08385 [Candidatus Omnitrophica bacterium]|jgi:hypothetical protein|nr:hypothetical protein [Candidatus Omnitrophota bacterium]
MGKAKDYIPALKFGHKIMPEDIAGMLGLPHVGNIYYVDPTNGNDTSNSGTSQGDALKTITAAYAKTTNYNHDVIVLVPGGTAGTAETAGITWSKHYVHLIGNTAPSNISPRSRVVFTTDATDPCLTISGNGNIFCNIQIATYQDSNDVLVSLTGDRNVFRNVHFAGIGSATCGDDATARCISMSGAEENLFEDCTIGLDTIARSTSNALVELASASTRNVFRDCKFLSYADNAGALFVKAASAADVDRFVMFERCLFHNAINSAATTMTVAMDLHASLGGSVILYDSWLFGATDWADDFTNVEVAGGGQATGNTAGLMVAAA